MDFKEAESKYHELKGRLDAGALTPDQFAEEVAKLRVQDDQGGLHQRAEVRDGPRPGTA